MTRNYIETQITLPAHVAKLHSGWANEASSGTYLVGQTQAPQVETDLDTRASLCYRNAPMKRTEN